MVIVWESGAHAQPGLSVGRTWNWSATVAAVALAYGPICIQAAAAFTPGPEAGALFLPGPVAGDSFTPGPEAGMADCGC